MRFLGTFLPDPLDVPTPVVAYLAEQLQIADPSCVKPYTEVSRSTVYKYVPELTGARRPAVDVVKAALPTPALLRPTA